MKPAGFSTIIGNQDPDYVREITGQYPDQRSPVRDDGGIQDHNRSQVYVCLGRIPCNVHVTPKSYAASVTGGPTIPIVARRHHIARDVHSESTTLATVSSIILSRLIKPARQHSQTIPSSPTSPQEESQFSQTVTQKNQEHMCPGQQQNFN